ncbi:MAG: hypothetical protein U1F21_09695 [Sphaerotilus natans]
MTGIAARGVALGAAQYLARMHWPRPACSACAARHWENLVALREPSEGEFRAGGVCHRPRAHHRQPLHRRQIWCAITTATSYMAISEQFIVDWGKDQRPAAG